MYQHVEVKTNYDHEDFEEFIQLTISEKIENLKHGSDFKQISSIRFPMIMFQCRAARRSGYFYWNAFLLIFLITSAVFTTFSIDFDKPHFRLPTTATLLLTSITFRWSYSSRCLPTVNYLTSLDKYSIGSLVLIYLCLIWHGISIWFLRVFKHETAQKLDKFFLAFLMLLYILFHAILFIWLRSAYSIRRSLMDKDSKLFRHEMKSAQSQIISNDNLIEEDNERNVIFNYNKRQSVFSTINNIDAIDDGNRKSRIRRLSTQFRGVLSNLSVNSGLNGSKINQNLKATDENNNSEEKV